jgi:hypothetical protein
VETSPRSGDRVDFAIGLEQDVPTGLAMVASAMTSGRDQASRSNPALAAKPAGDGSADLTHSRDVHTAPERSGALPGNTPQALTRSLDCLLIDARDACRRDGVPATRRELLARVAKRIGASQAEVARRLRDQAQHVDVPNQCATADTCPPGDPIVALAATILGAREREVFMARREARPDDIAALHRLAARMEISVERVYQLEASARRKLARALG